MRKIRIIMLNQKALNTLITLILIAILLVIVFIFVKPVIISIFYGMLLAYILYPIQKRLVKRIKNEKQEKFKK